MDRKRDFSTGSIPGHFRAMAVPTAIGMVFTTLYNFVDSYFAGLISTDALAGLAISFQVFFMLIAVGIGISTAMGTLVGRALGAGHAERAKQTAWQGLVVAILASLLLTALGYVLAPLMIGAVSEPGPFRELALDYISVLLLATPAFLITFAANGILTAQGDAISLQRAQIASFFANIVLNPLMIYGIPGVIDGFGFNGIALSTVTSQTGCLVYILWRVFKSDVLAHESPPFIRPRKDHALEIIAQAVPSSSAMIVMLIGSFVVQLYLRDFGPAAIAAYGVGLRVEQILLLPAFGLTFSLLPIAARNLGAGNFDRVREAFAFCCKAGVLLMLCASLILWLLGGLAMSIFTSDPEVVRLGSNYLSVDGFILPVYIVLFAINSLLQAFKRPMMTLWIGVYRQGIGIAVFAGLYVFAFGMDTWGVWIGIATSVITGLALALHLTARVARSEIGGLFRAPAARAG